MDSGYNARWTEHLTVEQRQLVLDSDGQRIRGELEAHYILEKVNP